MASASTVAIQDVLHRQFNIWRISTAGNLDAILQSRNGTMCPTCTAILWNVLVKHGSAIVYTIFVTPCEGTCHGGSLGGPYQWLYKKSKSGGPGISYFTSNPYLACSHESKEGFCPSGDWSCSDVNVAKTCGTFGEECVGLNQYPSATISDHGTIRGTSAMQKEIFNRGPVACGIDAVPIVDYTGGIAKGFALSVDHVISVVGWGNDAEEGMYWIVRNSWGEYWGEHGYARVKFGAMKLGDYCAWAVPLDFTAPERHNQYACFEDGSNCKAATELFA